MSRRSLNQTETRKNPVTKFLEWKSKEKCFEYWDKSQSANVKVEPPFKFMFLEHFHIIKGWHDASSSRIFSNEVKFIGKEPVKVRSFKGGDIVEGIYKDIKLEVLQAGGKYHRSVYVVNENGEIINMQLKGAVVAAYSDFLNENENKVEGAWCEINSVTDHKKGATKYSTPDFTIGKAFTKAEMSLANEKYLEIVKHFESVTAKPEVEVEDNGTLDMAGEVDIDLPY
jgi:hypothetical protein